MNTNINVDYITILQKRMHQQFFSNMICLMFSVEAKLHGESKVIQRYFDDNNDDDKGDDKKLKEQLKWIKNNSRVQDKNQEEFKTQEES